MATLALYRKYRPKTFKEVIGQENTVHILKNAVAQHAISHAYMFTGPRGSGKTSIARILAKAINCQNQKEGLPADLAGEPCNQCKACTEINTGRALDLVEIDAASNRGIDEMRSLKEGIQFSPASLAYKVFIIDEAHQLSKDAANALLKTLEEPPSHAIFILATTEVHKMIPTILSRCQRFDFRRLTVSEIVRRLQRLAEQEKASISTGALELIALQSGGSLRDAEGLLDKVLTFHSGSDTTKAIGETSVKELLGIVDITVTAEFTDFLIQKEPAKAIAFLHKNLQAGMDPQEFIKNVVQYLREIFLLQVNPNLEAIIEGFTQEQKDAIKKQAKEFKTADLRKTLESFVEAENKMKYASIIQLPLELAVIESCVEIVS